MAGYVRYQRDGLAGALTIHLLIYCAVGGGFFWGLYEFLQPTRFNNPGIAAYKAPPRTVIAYGPSSGFPPPPDATIPQPITTDDLASQLEPNVRSALAHALDEIETLERRQPLAGVKKLKRSQKALARTPSTQQEPGRSRVACIPRYDSSGAQSSPC
jgi:hypothetical protein